MFTDDRVCLDGLYTDATVYHEVCETFTVDQDYAGVDRPRIVDSLARETARGDKNALTGLLPVKCADKTLHLRTPDDIVGRIPLRLDIDTGEAKRVLV